MYTNNTINLFLKRWINLIFIIYPTTNNIGFNICVKWCDVYKNTIFTIFIWKYLKYACRIKNIYFIDLELF